MQARVRFATLLLRCALALLQRRKEPANVELALRQQLAACGQARPTPRLSSLDRALRVALQQLWPGWKEVPVSVEPKTVIGRHRKGFRLYWRFLSGRRPGRPSIPREMRQLTCRLAFENGWGARKIQRELSKLGFAISLAAILCYLPKRSPDPGRRLRWVTFLRNQRDAIAAMDFRIVPTVSFRLMYVWFLIDHGQRRLIHLNVTTNPSARWVIQQLREAFPSDRTPCYPLLDRDSIFSAEVMAAIRSFGIDPVRTGYRSPWQNPVSERWVRTCRRELLDHVTVFGERHLRRLLADYVAYCNGERVHTGLDDSPDGRPIENRPSPAASVVGLPRVGGLHHRHVWAEAA